MKNYLLSIIVLILLFAFSINAQNFKRLKNLADNLEKQSKELVDKTSEDIDKDGAVTGIEIERAFLAEQTLASAKLMKQLVDDKFQLSELRSGGKVLQILSKTFPPNGSHISNWNSVKISIESLNNELASNGSSATAMPIIEDKEVSGRVFWTGTVDATVHLIIKGSQIKTVTRTGKTYPDGIPSFTSSMPDSGNYLIGVKKKDGRGDVKVIQQPNAENDYTAIVEIHDEGGGAKSYTVEIFW